MKKIFNFFLIGEGLTPDNIGVYCKQDNGVIIAIVNGEFYRGYKDLSKLKKSTLYDHQRSLLLKADALRKNCVLQPIEEVGKKGAIMGLCKKEIQGNLTKVTGFTSSSGKPLKAHRITRNATNPVFKVILNIHYCKIETLYDSTNDSVESTVWRLQEIFEDCLMWVPVIVAEFEEDLKKPLRAFENAAKHTEMIPFYCNAVNKILDTVIRY